MTNEEGRSIEDVAAQCLACKWKDSDKCDCCDNKPVVMCIPHSRPLNMNGDIILLENAKEKVLLQLNRITFNTVGG